MPYADVQTLLNDIASFYDDSPTADFALPSSKINRYVHYVQLGVYEIWNFRAWYFKMAQKTGITFTAGEYALPTSFANVGPNGRLFDSVGRPWTEISFQDMVQLRARGAGASKPDRVFCVGTIESAPTGALGSGGLTTAQNRGLIIPNNSTSEVFSLFFETSPPFIDPTPAALADPIPLPETFHEVLLYAAVTKLQEAKGDPRPTWRGQYMSQLAKLAAIHYPLASRMNQMPMTVGGQW